MKPKIISKDKDMNKNEELLTPSQRWRQQRDERIINEYTALKANASDEVTLTSITRSIADKTLVSLSTVRRVLMDNGLI